jgi:hypothetical protein
MVFPSRSSAAIFRHQSDQNIVITGANKWKSNSIGWGLSIRIFMGKRVPSVEERPTNSSFELPERVTTQAYSFGAANAAIREAWIRTSRISCGSDFGGLI